MRLTHKSQSALEYMMTYGWAILIIVIVAVILYSMGIFNPSSSVTPTSSGFSPFVIQSVLCSSNGLVFSVVAGPTSSPVVQISKIYFTSAVGMNATSATYVLPSPVTLKSGASALILIPDVKCKVVGTRFYTSGKIQYSYLSPAGNVVTNATGTIAGISSLLKRTAYVPLTITSSTATSNPFQQMITVNMSKYKMYASPTLNNIEFTYSNGSIIPSWRENGTTNSQVVVYWLKLGSFTTVTVHMDFLPIGQNVLNTVNTGEAPQLSSTYAEYDDGANVFIDYYNMQKPLYEYYSQYYYCGPLSIASGTGPFGTQQPLLEVTGASTGCNSFIDLTTPSNVPANFIVTAIEEMPGGTNGAGVGVISGSAYNGYLFTLGSDSGADADLWKVSSSTTLNSLISGPIPANSGTWYSAELVFGSGSLSGYMAAGSFVYLPDYTTPAIRAEGSTLIYTSFSGLDLFTAGDAYWALIVLYAYPPNDVMPSVSFGSVSLRI